MKKSAKTDHVTVVFLTKHAIALGYTPERQPKMNQITINAITYMRYFLWDNLNAIDR